MIFKHCDTPSKIESLVSVQITSIFYFSFGLMMDANLNKSFSFKNFAYRKNLSKYALQSKTRWKLIEGGMPSNKSRLLKKARCAAGNSSALFFFASKALVLWPFQFPTLGNSLFFVMPKTNKPFSQFYKCYLTPEWRYQHRST